jgi:drug/metabolite transporter (DMT)-like permease
MDNLRGKSVLYLVITAILWSSGGALIKLVSWNPVAIAGGRSLIAALVFLVVLGKPKFSFSLMQIGGAVSYALTVILFVTANKMTTAANGILLQYTAPLFAAVLGAWFLKEKVKKADWILIFFVTAGVSLFFIDDLSTSGFWGNIIAILSGLTFACLPIFMRLQKDESTMETILLGNLLAFFIGLPFMFGSLPDTKSIIGLVLLGVFQLGLSYMLFSFAVKHVTALEAVLIPVIEPILNPIWVMLVTAEMPGMWAIVGGLVVIASVTIKCIIPVRSMKEQNSA